MAADKSKALLKNETTGESAALEREGMLLHPEIAKRWEEYGVKDAPERIFKMAEKESDRRHRINLLSSFLGFSTILCFFGLCFYMIYEGQTAKAMGTFLSSFAGVLIAAAKFKKKQ